MSLFKGVRKVFKKIGRAVKKQFKRVMKIVNKAGVLGQIAMMFILPGVGGALMKGLTGAFKGLVGATVEGVAASAVTSQAAVTAGTAATNAVGTGTATATQTAAIKAGDIATKSLAKQVGKGILKKSAEGVFTATRGTGLLGSSSALANGVGTVLKAAGNFVKVGAKAFSTVTEGISSFIGEFGKTALNKIPGINIGTAAPDFATAWSNVQNNVMTNASETLKAFNTSIGYTPPTTGGLANYKPTARISNNSLMQARNAPISSAPTNMSPNVTPTSSPVQSPDLLEGARASTDLVNQTIETAKPPLPKASEGVEFYENLKTADNSLLTKRPSPLRPVSTSAESMRLPGADGADFQSAMEQTANAGLPKPPTTNFVATTPPPVAATDPNYFDILRSKATDALKEFSPSSLLERVQEIPGQFLDNLGNTITKLPQTALSASLNKPRAGYNVSTQVVGAPMPVAEVASLQPSTGGTPAQALEYYQGLQRSGTGSYGFASNDGYNQFMKKFA